MATSNIQTRDVSAHPSVSLWRNRDFLLLWGGQTLSSVGTEASTLAFTLLVLALTHSPAQAGIVTAVGAVPGLLLNVPAGALVDRVDRKRLMIVCDVLRMLNFAAIPLALVLGHLTLAQLYLFAVINGVCTVFFRLANMVCLPRVVAREQLPDAVARREATEGAVTLLGPSLGGALFAVGRALPFLVDTISYVASLASLLLIRTPFQGERQPSGRGVLVEIREGLAWMWRQRLVRFMALIYGGFAFAFPGSTLCVIILAQQRGASAFLIGIIFAFGGVGGIVGALVGPWVRRRVRFGRLIPLLGWGYALLQPLYVLAPVPLLMGVVEALVMVNDQIYDIVWPSYRLALIPDALQGRVNGAFRLFPGVAQPLGLLLTGLLIQSLGAATTMLLLGAWIALLALLATLNPHVRSAPSIEEVAP